MDKQSDPISVLLNSFGWSTYNRSYCIFIHNVYKRHWISARTTDEGFITHHLPNKRKIKISNEFLARYLEILNRYLSYKVHRNMRKYFLKKKS
jgi:hypothetical protein